MIQIVKGKELNKKLRKEMSKLFVCSFFDAFSAFCKDKEKLIKAFYNIFELSCFYSVLLDNEIIGMGAVSDGSSPIKFSKCRLYKCFGVKQGKSIYSHLNSLFVNRDYDFEMDDLCGMIEFICVKEEYRNRKVGFTLVNHIMHDNKYVRYLAKVGNNNYYARTLFEGIGFEEFHVEEASKYEKENLGLENNIYLIYQKN